MYEFEKCLPRESRVALWALQNFLINEAERLVGPMNVDKDIFQPTFENEGPFIRNRVEHDGAWAVLSPNALSYWPTALYELAHETIHLLDPVVGHTNYLEEGIAVAFSVEMSRTHTQHPMAPNDQFYSRAFDLVRMLPVSVYDSAFKIRERCGALGSTTSADLLLLFPGVDEKVINELCSECNFTTDI